MEFLRQRVEERLTARQELTMKLQSMELQIRQRYEQAQYHDQMALTAQCLAQSNSLAIQIGTGNIPMVGTRSLDVEQSFSNDGNLDGLLAVK